MTNNIELESAKINPDLLEKEEEKNLYYKLNNLKEKVKNDFNSKEYESGLRKLVQIKTPVDNFLDNVMVMSDDERIRQNRLALLAEVASLNQGIFDLNEIALD